MEKNLFKFISKDEIPKKSLNKSKEIYVFDFDDTLVTDTATIYIIKPCGRRKPMSSSNYYMYELKQNEKVDVSEFNKVIDPIIHDETYKLLKKHLDKSAILTARSEARPIRHFMNKIKTPVPTIVAVGSNSLENNSVLQNAERKKMWLEYTIKTESLDYVEVWDDNEINIDKISSLRKKYTTVKIITHLVEHDLPKDF